MYILFPEEPQIDYKENNNRFVCCLMMHYNRNDAWPFLDDTLEQRKLASH